MLTLMKKGRRPQSFFCRSRCCFRRRQTTELSKLFEDSSAFEGELSTTLSSADKSWSIVMKKMLWDFLVLVVRSVDGGVPQLPLRVRLIP
jgi:hypothetical protein